MHKGFHKFVCGTQKFNYLDSFKMSSHRREVKVKAIIFGAPGAGKGTYSTMLKAKLGVEVIAMGDIFRAQVKENSELGKRVKS